jgi:hypothetical protein
MLSTQLEETYVFSKFPGRLSEHFLLFGESKINNG